MRISVSSNTTDGRSDDDDADEDEDEDEDEVDMASLSASSDDDDTLTEPGGEIHKLDKRICLQKQQQTKRHVIQ